jgi:hypothetical protein
MENTKPSKIQSEQNKAEQRIQFKRAKTFMELDHVINSAGGFFEPEELLNLTVYEFIINVAAQNNIHFMFIPEVDVND